MTPAEKLAQLEADLLPLNETGARLAWLVEQARHRPSMPAELRLDAHRIEGCLARLWLAADFRGQRCYFQSDSDSLVVKSVAGLLCDFYSDLTPAQIIEHDPAFLGRLGINPHLTVNRRNALASMWDKIRRFAEAQSDHAPLRRP